MNQADRQQTLLSILEQLTASEAVMLALLANNDGFLVAAVPDDDRASVAAAVGASLYQLAVRVADDRDVDEIAVRFSDLQRLVCRSIPGEQSGILLIIVIQPGRAYRRLSNQAMSQIHTAWKTI